jgi:hypothetical protein
LAAVQEWGYGVIARLPKFLFFSKTWAYKEFIKNLVKRVYGLNLEEGGHPGPAIG